MARELELDSAGGAGTNPGFGRLDDAGETSGLSRELPLAPALSSVRAGRHFAERTLSDWDVPRQPIEDAVMIVSELVTNAIRHGSPPIRLRLRKVANEVAIEVDDGEDAMPRRRTPTVETLGGRGLAIVAALSRRWSADRTDSGKTVRCVLATKPC